MAIEIQLRRDTATEWSRVNPILAQGEFGYELDTGYAKIGDGLTPWNKLHYFNTGGGGGSLAIGETISDGLANSILFVDADGALAQDNNNLFYDEITGETKIGSANSTGTSGIYSLSTLTKIGDFNSNGNGTKIVIDDSVLTTTIYNNLAINGLTDAMLCADTVTGNISPVTVGTGVQYDPTTRIVTAGYTNGNTLFVDPNGNNGSALVGRADYPWSDIGSALQYLHDNAMTGYTIWVMPGRYTENADWVIDDQNNGTTIKFQGGVRVISNFGIRVSNSAMTAPIYFSMIGDDEGQNIGDAYTSNTVLSMASSVMLFDYAVVNMTNIHHRIRNLANINFKASGNGGQLLLNNCHLKTELNGSNIQDSSQNGDMLISIRNSFLHASATGNMNPNISFTFPVINQNNIQILNSRFYCEGVGIDPLRQGQINTNGLNGSPAYWITMSDVTFFSRVHSSYVWYDISPSAPDFNNLDVIASVTTNQNDLGSAGVIMNYTTTNTINQLQPINNIYIFGR